MANNFIKQLKKIDKDYYSIVDLEKISGLKRKSLLVKLNRLEQKGEIKRFVRGFYQLDEKSTDLEKIITQIYSNTYISFEFALSKYGIMSQIPYAITLATFKKPRKIEIIGRLVEFRQLKKELFFGFNLVDNTYIADPEKALLDQLYLVSKGKATLALNELNLKNIRKTLLLKYAKKFSKPTQKLVQKLTNKIGKTNVGVK